MDEEKIGGKKDGAGRRLDGRKAGRKEDKKEGRKNNQRWIDPILKTYPNDQSPNHHIPRSRGAEEPYNLLSPRRHTRVDQGRTEGRKERRKDGRKKDSKK